MPSIAQSFVSFGGKILNVLVWISVVLFFLWAVGAIYYLFYLPGPLRFALAIVYAIAVVWWVWNTRASTAGRAIVIALIGLIFLATLLIRPSNERDWDPDHAQVANVSMENGIVTIQNFRHCVYRSELEYDPSFSTRQFPLDNIDSVWLIVQKFSAAEGLAHVFLSFGLKPGTEPEFFSISVEVRRELGETYSPIRGLYRAYELTHVIGDERDLIGVRTIHRPNDRLWMYRINATEEQAQDLFTQFAKRIQRLQERPQFYHTLLNNCANGITQLTYNLTPQPINWLDTRIVLPGYSAELAFDHGLIGNRSSGQTLDELTAESRIDLRARKVGITDSFSNDIRREMLAD